MCGVSDRKALDGKSCHQIMRYTSKNMTFVDVALLGLNVVFSNIVLRVLYAEDQASMALG